MTRNLPRSYILSYFRCHKSSTNLTILHYILLQTFKKFDNFTIYKNSNTDDLCQVHRIQFVH